MSPVPETDLKSRIKPSWIIATTAPVPIALDTLTQALVAAKFRTKQTDPMTRRLKLGSVLRAYFSELLYIELLPGMRSWGFVAQVDLHASMNAGHTEVLVKLASAFPTPWIATRYTARALEPALAALSSNGARAWVSPIFEGKSVQKNAPQEQAFAREQLAAAMERDDST